MSESSNESKDSTFSERILWKGIIGAILTGILFLFYAFGIILYSELALFLFPSLSFAVFYGVFSDDLKLSALFGFLFQLNPYLAFYLRVIEAPSPSVILYILMWGLIHTFFGVISAWMGKDIRIKFDRLPAMRWKARVGVLFMGILLLFYSTAFTEGGLLFSLTFIFAVFYGLLTSELKLSVFFGFIFQLDLYLGVSLYVQETPPLSAIPTILIGGLLTAFSGGISAWIGKRILYEKSMM